ncbi:response regulator [Roseomonas chloroacetimidivorans]|uniref:response regulator n=1 Tax=Roseomonas chloroacetimidivorans TaxID=1766656 RepID=UPI003C707A53
MPDGSKCGGAPHVLVAEDEPPVAMVIDDSLTDGGFCVTCAPDGLVAVAELATQSFDAVVTDVRMPNLDGVGLVRSILSRYSRMPIIVLSGYMTPQQRSDLLGLGIPAEALLEKPNGFRQLRGILARLLGPSRR